jgi:hypothetical protein
MRTRESLINVFQHTTVPHGDDNRPVRGVIARCGHCDAAISTAVNTIQGHSNNDEVEWQYIARRFEAKGWRIGRTRSAHRCPKCLNAAKFAAIKRVSDAALAPKAEPKTNGEHAMQVIENTRVMGREDRRIIFEKLRETYVDEKVGYSEGWTDEKIASHLGVPRAWVRVIRDENFGDEISNESIRAKVAEAVTALAQLRAAEPEMRRLMGLADKIERSLAEIQKVFLK